MHWIWYFLQTFDVFKKFVKLAYKIAVVIAAVVLLYTITISDSKMAK